MLLAFCAPIGNLRPPYTTHAEAVPERHTQHSLGGYRMSRPETATMPRSWPVAVSGPTGGRFDLPPEYTLGKPIVPLIVQLADA